MNTLEGCRVLDLGHVWAGSFAAQVLADLGAEVIRVESRSHVDVHRRAGPYAGGRRDINSSAVWNAQNRRKLSCTLNLKQPEGSALALRLIGASDVIFENYTPGTLEHLGLSYESMCASNPRIVLVSLSGYGQNGPWSRYPAYGPMMDAVAGLSYATRTPEGVPQSVNGWFPDTSAGLYAALAAVVAHADARKSGQGAHVDISQLEAAASLLPEFFMGLDEASVFANSSADGGDALVLPALGSDTWIALVLRDGDWARVAATLEIPQVQASLDARGRPTANSQQLLAEAVAARDRDEVCTSLQAAGVEAVPVLAAPDLVTDAHLASRNVFMESEHPSVGPFRSYGPVIRSRDEQGSGGRAPLLGEHNDYVFREILGLSERRQTELEASEVIW